MRRYPLCHVLDNGGNDLGSWNLLGIPFVVVLLGVAFFLTQFRVLNTLLIGDESALTLGIQVATIRKVYLVFSSANHRCCSSCIRNNRLLLG